MDKRFLAIVGVLIAVFLGILFLKQDKTSTPTSPAQATKHIKGPAEATVTLLEYGDYQCPACESFNPTVDAVITKYSDKIKFQFRNLPLIQIHTHAFAAARAAEAADIQGKFWEMHDALYNANNWTQWTASSVSDPKPFFWQYAQQLGLNIDKFKTDFASEAVNKRINSDIAAFNETKEAMSTPTFFLNGKAIENNDLLGSDGQPSVEAFSKVIDEALAKK